MVFIQCIIYTISIIVLKIIKKHYRITKNTDKSV